MRLGCSRCGKLLSTEIPEGTIVRAWIECPECIEKEPSWEKEFEDKLDCIYKISELITKYLKWHEKVKIKCKDGCIQIERTQ